MLTRASFKIKKLNMFAQNYTSSKHQSKKSSKGFGEWMEIFESFKPMELTALSHFFHSKPIKHLSPINDTSLNTTEIIEEEDKVNEMVFVEQNAILDKALIKDPENPRYYFEKALLLFNRSYWLESLALLEKALWIDPNMQEALKLKTTAIKKSKLNLPENAFKASFIKGVALFEIQQYKEALNEFTTCTQLNPLFKEARYNLIITEKICNSIRKYAKDRASNSNENSNENRNRTSNSNKVTGHRLGVSTHYEYAVLSAYTYKSGGGYLLPNCWEVFKTSDDIHDIDGSYSRDGFYAVAYLNHRYKELVIGFQGTDTYSDFVTGLHHTWDTVDRQYICAELFTETILTEKNEHYSNYKVIFTGHSLGAAQAEYMAIKNAFCAVTFESPGITSLLKKLNFTEIRNADHLITCYLSRPNAINIARPKLGKLIRLYPHFKINSIVDEFSFSSFVFNTLNLIKRFTSVFQFQEDSTVRESISAELMEFIHHCERFFKQTLHWHSINSILSTMELEYSHNVAFYMTEALDWPHIDTIAMYYNITADCSNTEPDFCILGELNKRSLKSACYQHTLLTFEVKEKDPFFLDINSCSPSVIKLLNTIERNREATFQKDHIFLNNNDKLVLSNYSAVYDETNSYSGLDNETSERELVGYRITSGLFAYQFLDYLSKNNLPNLLTCE